MALAPFDAAVEQDEVMAIRSGKSNQITLAAIEVEVKVT